MSEYYDKDKFSGGQRRPTPPPFTPPRNNGQTPPWSNNAPPSRPPRPSQGGGRRPNPDEGWWHSWPVLIILFVVGLWPAALALLIYHILQEDKQQTQRNQEAARRMAENTSYTETAAERAIRQARERSAADQAARKAAQSAGDTRRADSAPAPQPAAPAFQAPAAPRPQPGQPGKRRPVRAPLSSYLLRIFGVLFLAVGGISLSETLPDVIRFGSVYLSDLFASLGFAVTGGVMFWRGQVLASRTRRSQRYILAIGNADVMRIDEIAKRVNRTPEKTVKELQKLIDKGYLGEDAYIDHERGYFLRFGATPEDEPQAQQPVPEQTEEGYSGILRGIRRANDRIADEELSRKIDRLEQVSALIFKEVEEHPEKRESIHTFFDYYLPTTQKLLDTYADFEETGVEGENLRQAKERIEQTMDGIVAGFEHQLDQLYSADAMDVVSDIKVMEAMLNRDTASVARDFGYSHPPKAQPGDAAPEQAGGDAQDGGDVQQLQL